MLLAVVMNCLFKILFKILLQYYLYEKKTQFHSLNLGFPH